MSPVDAHATARTGLPSAIICLTLETRTVMPRSLNDPVWLVPHCLIHRSRSPSWAPYRSAQNKLVPPSNSETTFSSATWGWTSSFLPHTPLP